jgi:uncharacterized integral membrane protein
MYKIVSILVFALLVAMFAYLNSAPVNLWLPFVGSREVVQSFVILGSATAGAIIVLLAGMVAQVKNMIKVRELNNKIKELESKRDEANKNSEEAIKREENLQKELNHIKEKIEKQGVEHKEKVKNPEFKELSECVNYLNKEGNKDNGAEETQ